MTEFKFVCMRCPDALIPPENNKLTRISVSQKHFNSESKSTWKEKNTCETRQARSMKVA